jgi:hypothetical protein
MARVAVRWTIGDVSARGFEALTLSIAGAKRIFRDDARYVVCVNTIGIDVAAARVGDMAADVEWRQADAEIPEWLNEYTDSGMAEGVAWKLAPLEIASDLPTIALDNDVVLWRMPDSICGWLEEGDSLLIAQDVRSCYGIFGDWCPAAARNSGIRGTPAGFPLKQRLMALLERSRATLRSETDEQGLQVAMISREKHHLVTLDEVSICGYFRPHQLDFGSCGAHFVGVNSKKLPYKWKGRSGEAYVHGFWDERKA